jgi:hypothetical protein
MVAGGGTKRDATGCNAASKRALARAREGHPGRRTGDLSSAPAGARRAATRSRWRRCASTTGYHPSRLPARSRAQDTQPGEYGRKTGFRSRRSSNWTRISAQFLVTQSRRRAPPSLWMTPGAALRRFWMTRKRPSASPDSQRLQHIGQASFFNFQFSIFNSALHQRHHRCIRSHSWQERSGGSCLTGCAAGKRPVPAAR